MRKCSKCEKLKDESDFYKNYRICKVCQSNYAKEYRLKNIEKSRGYEKKWRDNNKEKSSTYSKKWRDNNKEHVTNRSKKYYQDNILKIKKETSIRDKNRWQVNRESELKRNSEWERKRRHADPVYRFKDNVSKLIRRTVSKSGFIKKSKTVDILGCSNEYFRFYIELQLEPWMNFENYGKYDGKSFMLGWDLDHILPSSKITTEEEVILYNHHSNFRPLCSHINRDKRKNKNADISDIFLLVARVLYNLENNPDLREKLKLNYGKII